MKHVFDDRSQQLVPMAGAGQLFWQSLSLEHIDTQAFPPPEPPLLLEVLPLPPPLDEPL
jgi:hypothetical protein